MSVNKINNIKNNGLIIECNSKKECESLKENILINAKLSEECSTLLPMKTKPKIIIYNVPKDVDTKNIIKNIVKQNILIDEDIVNVKLEEEIKYKFKLNSKNENLNHIVIETTRELRRKIINKKYINIE